MLYLRDQGFDVVEVGTTSATRDTTLVLDRSRHREWAQNVATSLGTARVESRPDSSRHPDVTVLVALSGGRRSNRSTRVDHTPGDPRRWPSDRYPTPFRRSRANSVIRLGGVGTKPRAP
jgi:hypothetical protein